MDFMFNSSSTPPRHEVATGASNFCPQKIENTKNDASFFDDDDEDDLGNLKFNVNTTEENYESLWPTPIDSSSVRVVSSLPLDGASILAQDNTPESLETLYGDLLVQLFDSQNDDPLPLDVASILATDNTPESLETSYGDVLVQLFDDQNDAPLLHPSQYISFDNEATTLSLHDNAIVTAAAAAADAHDSLTMINPSASVCLSSSTFPSSFTSIISSSNKRSRTEDPPENYFYDAMMPMTLGQHHETKKPKVASLLCETIDENSIKMDSRPIQSSRWKESFQALCEFHKIHGHCIVPPRYNGDNSLWRWMKRQRYQYKLQQEGRKSKAISDDRIAALESIGFVWDSQRTLWMERLQELEDYYGNHGHCNVPSKYPPNEPLSTWVKCQRRQFKLYREGSNSSMTKERIAALNNLGFVFQPRG